MSVVFELSLLSVHDPDLARRLAAAAERDPDAARAAVELLRDDDRVEILAMPQLSAQGPAHVELTESRLVDRHVPPGEGELRRLHVERQEEGPWLTLDLIPVEGDGTFELRLEVDRVERLEGLDLEQRFDLATVLVADEAMVSLSPVGAPGTLILARTALADSPARLKAWKDAADAIVAEHRTTTARARRRAVDALLGR